LRSLVHKFIEAFVMNGSNASLAEMNMFMSYTSGFWMMDGGYVGEYHAQTKTYTDEIKS
jgi:hypothetical protein